LKVYLLASLMARLFVWFIQLFVCYWFVCLFGYLYVWLYFRLYSCFNDQRMA
jgi:hypothetical protein